MNPGAGKPLILLIFVCYSSPYFWLCGIPIAFLLKFFMNVRLDLSYGESWPSQPKRLIFKVKRTPEQVKRAPEQVNPPFCRFSCTIVHGFFGDPSDLIFAKKFHEHPLKP
ncbi:hypothetical protein H5410_044078 [Solanum commersonii]|uniref:Uncharacterized protein n=1 Tax=Solanum commersonii TaxID=4109 RepID=A0A9J5Y2N9_SOLCO|nr:hypothetical protein H5410_044078 [Solanum commersonii]